MGESGKKVITIKPAWAYYTDKMWNYFLPRRKHHDQTGTEQMHFRDDIDELNWNTCQRVWNGFTAQQREIMFLIYCTEYEQTPDAVRRYAAGHGAEARDVWAVAAQCSRKLAVERRLVADAAYRTGGDNQNAPHRKG